MRSRPVLRLWHRWFGIMVGGWLLLLAATGSAIAWYDELDSWLNPELRMAPVTQEAPASMDRVVTQAQAELPGFTANNIILAPEPGKTHWLIGRQVVPGGEARALQVFSDPASGEVAGWRDSEAHRLDRKHLLDLLYALHVDLLLGEIGLWIVGLIGLAWLIDHFLSLPLAFPRWGKWRAAFGLSGRPGSLRRLYDWHRAKGVWLWLVTGTLALTGVTLTFHESSRHVVELVSPISSRLHETMPEVDPPNDPVGLDAAMTAVVPDRNSIHSLRIFPYAGVYAVRTFDDRDVDNQGRLWTYVRMADGEIVGSRHDIGDSAGDYFFALQYPLHSGHFAGAAGRVIVTLAGILAIALCISGWLLLLRRMRKSKREP